MLQGLHFSVQGSDETVHQMRLETNREQIEPSGARRGEENSETIITHSLVNGTKI